MKLGNRVWVRVKKRWGPDDVSESLPVLAEVVYVSVGEPGQNNRGLFTTVKLLDDPGLVGWYAGDSYRCCTGELTAANRPTNELLTGTGETCPVS